MDSENRCWRVLALVLAFGLFAGVATAQKEEEPRWMLLLVGFFPDVDSNIRVNDPDLGVTPTIDFEDLGLKSNVTALRLGAAVRLSENGRHLLEFEYLKISRSGRIMLDEDLEFGGEVFPIGLRVNGEVNTQDFDIHYTYNVLKNERGSLGLSIGIHAIDFEASATGVATIGGGGQQIGFGQQVRVGDQFPLPLVGMRFGYEVVEHLELTGGFKWLSATVDEIDGAFTDAWLRIEYQLAKPVSLGVGLARIDVDYDRKINQAKREIISASYVYSGAEAFVRFRF